MLRPLFKRFSSSYGSSGRYGTGRSGANNIALVTIGGTGGRRTHVKLTNADSDTVVGDGDHHSEDDESARRILKVHVTHEVRQDSAKAGDGRDGVQFQVAVGSPRHEHGPGLKSSQYYN